ncbi:MAG: anti-sigma factor domain-containing protein [Propionibacteriaceae bacterium]
MSGDRTIEHDNVGAYVSDALDDREREEFESHMAGCEVCEREVRDFAETLAELTFATQLTPPADLRDSVLTAIARVRPLPPLEVEEAEVGAADGDPTAAVTAAHPRHALAAVPPAVDEHDQDRPVAAVARLDEVRARRIRRVLSLAVAAALVIAVALGVSVVNLNQEAKRQQQVANARADVIAAPDAKVYPVTMQDGSQASYVVSKSLNRALFVGADVAGLPADKVYQLWTTADASTYRSAGTFAGTGTQQILIDQNVSDTKALAITIEPSNGGQGSTAPTIVKSGPGKQPFAATEVPA